MGVGGWGLGGDGESKHGFNITQVDIARDKGVTDGPRQDEYRASLGNLLIGADQ